MTEQGSGVILNVSSIAAFQPLTKGVGYSAAKAAVNNFTQWLAVHMAQEFSPDIRVNAIAPGFFLTEQNRFLLTDEGGFDLILSFGQVVPHEVVGMANYNKNIFIGTGGRRGINRSHYLGAVYGMDWDYGRIEKN